MSLKKFQQLAGVDPDGIFGEKTFKAGSKYLGITDHSCAVHFFSQCAHESGGFNVFKENLKYNFSGLISVFGKYFTTEEAIKYQYQPEMIANRVYANRMDNGDEQSGDGWTFRGRGALQLTGKKNYQAFANTIGDPCIMEEPDIVATEHSFTSAQWYFGSNMLWAICKKGLDVSTIEQLTKRINGGLNGIDDRIALTKKYSAYKLVS